MGNGTGKGLVVVVPTVRACPQPRQHVYYSSLSKNRSVLWLWWSRPISSSAVVSDIIGGFVWLSLIRFCVSFENRETSIVLISSVRLFLFLIVSTLGVQMLGSMAICIF